MSGQQSLGTIVDALLRGDRDAALKLLHQTGTAGLRGIATTMRNTYLDARQPRQSTSTSPAGGVRPEIRIPPQVQAALGRGDILGAAQCLRDANPQQDMVTLGTVLDRLRHGRAVDAGANTGTGEQASASASSTRSTYPFANRQRPPTVAPGDRGGSAVVGLALLVGVSAIVWWAVGS